MWRREVRNMAGGGGYDLGEIRRRADIVEIISPHVALRKAGRRLTGLCPFHQERTPSFTVDPESGLWHCFGCKAGGDLFRFVEMVEKVDFGEAVELLARRLGVQPRSPEQAGRQHDRERLLAIHEAACAFFQAQLKTEAGERARAYLERRGLSPATIEAFSIGYAPPGWDGLLIAVGRKGYPGHELAKAGLVIARENHDGFYDRFRDRVIFPIRDSSGRVIAFGGRALDEEQQPKYLNSPDSALFQKGHVLYAFDRARRVMGEAGQAIIVEGYLDAIACHDAGFGETVATMGTALTPDHVEMLRRRVPRLVLAFDADSAGMAAALRGRELFQQSGLAVRVLSLPDGLDPDQVVRERGREAFAALIEAAVPMIEWELARIYERVAAADEVTRMEGMKEAAATLARLPAAIEREYYIRWMVGKWGAGSPSQAAAMEAAVREEIAQLAARRRETGRRTEQPAPGADDVNKQAPAPRRAILSQEELLSSLVSHGDLAKPYLEQLAPEDFPEEARDILAAVRGLTERGEQVSAQSVLEELSGKAKPFLAQLMLNAVPGLRVEEAVAKSVARSVETRLNRQAAELRQRSREAKSAEEQTQIHRELIQVMAERSRLAGKRIVGEG